MTNPGFQRNVLFSILASLALVLSTGSLKASELRRNAIVNAVEKARGAVVNIHGQKVVQTGERHSDSTKRVNGMGTGVVVDSRGYILTNFHVVEGVRRIRVTLANGEAYIARLVAHDAGTDLAVIKIPVNRRLPVINVGSSQDIMTGETVIAVGNAYGYEHTVTTGIVSAQKRNVKVNEVQSYRNLLQTDASINPGNSGGPLLNIDGEMIGINVAVRVGAQGIGFAIPVDMGMQVAAKLMSVERLSGLWHGVIHEDQNVGNQSQLIVRNVQAGSPAQRAGIRQGDVIQQVAGRPIGRGIDFESAFIGTQSGSPINLTVKRNNAPLNLQVGLVKHPGSSVVSNLANSELLPVANQQDPIWDVLGVEANVVGKSDLQAVKFRGGLRITRLKNNGLASRLGIQVSDVLVGVHEWETISLDNLLYIVREADFGDQQQVPFYVLRNGRTLSGNLAVDDLSVIEVARR